MPWPMDLREVFLAFLTDCERYVTVDNLGARLV